MLDLIWKNHYTMRSPALRKEATSASRDRDKAQKENEKLRRQLDRDQEADDDVHSLGATAAD